MKCLCAPLLLIKLSFEMYRNFLLDSGWPSGLVQAAGTQYNKPRSAVTQHIIGRGGGRRKGWGRRKERRRGERGGREEGGRRKGWGRRREKEGGGAHMKEPWVGKVRKLQLQNPIS
jgi:hypothetical protein